MRLMAAPIANRGARPASVAVPRSVKYRRSIMAGIIARTIVARCAKLREAQSRTSARPQFCNARTGSPTLGREAHRGLKGRTTRVALPQVTHTAAVETFRPLGNVDALAALRAFNYGT